MFCSEKEMLTRLKPVLITVISEGIIINPKKMSGSKIVFQTTLLRKPLIALLQTLLMTVPVTALETVTVLLEHATAF